MMAKFGEDQEKVQNLREFGMPAEFDKLVIKLFKLK